MTRIPLKFINNQIKADVLLDAESYRIRLKPIKFIIDTGSSRSFLSEGDALSIKMPLESLSHMESIRMGGSKYNLFGTKKMALLLRTDEDKLYKIPLPSFAVSRATKKTEEARQESQNFPSIIGTDFFTANKMFLHFDPSESNIYLGTKE